MSTWETAKPVNFREIHILWILKHRLGVINHNANLGKNMFFKMFVGKWPTAVLNIFPYYVKQWLDILKTSASCAKGRLVWPIPIWCWWLGLVVPWVWPRIWGHWPYEAYGAWGDWEGRHSLAARPDLGIYLEAASHIPSASHIQPIKSMITIIIINSFVDLPAGKYKKPILILYSIIKGWLWERIEIGGRAPISVSWASGLSPPMTTPDNAVAASQSYLNSYFPLLQAQAWLYCTERFCVNMFFCTKPFLGPQEPLRIPLIPVPSRLQEKSRSPLQPYKSS